jgi:hypothetical protein
MRYTLLVAMISAAICCAQDTGVSKQSLRGTISNLDPEPAPYSPDQSLPYAAAPTPNLRSSRFDSAPGPSLGAIADFHETYGVPSFAPDVLYPTYLGGGFQRPSGHPIGHISVHAGGGHRK